MKQIVQTRVNHSLSLSDNEMKPVAEIILVFIEPQYKYIDGNTVKTLKTSECRFDSTQTQLTEIIESLVTIRDSMDKLHGVAEIATEELKELLKTND